MPKGFVHLGVAGVQAVMDGLIADRSTVTQETVEKEAPRVGLENMCQLPVSGPEIVLSRSGIYNGTLQTSESLVGNNCYCLVAAQVCDVTDGGFSIIAEKTIVERGYSFLMLPNTVAGTIGSSNSMQCTLQAGHTYLLRLKLYTSAKADLLEGIFSWGLSDFDNSGADGQGVDYENVNLTWN